jgi:YHS domain-containing protein
LLGTNNYATSPGALEASSGFSTLGENKMAMQTDPVCGMQVDDQKATAKSQFQGTNYYFCSDECKRKFDQQPQQYASKAGRAGGGGQGGGGQAHGGSKR